MTFDTDPVNGGAQGGGGVWQEGVQSNWHNGTSNAKWHNDSENPATFGGATGAATVSVAGTVQAKSLRFKSSGYTLEGGTIELTEGTIRADGDAAIESTLVTAGQLVKEGLGELTISGVQVHQPGTDIEVLAGGLVLGSDVGVGVSIDVRSGASLVLDASQHLESLGIRGTGSVKLTPGGGKVLVLDSLVFTDFEIAPTTNVPEPGGLAVVVSGLAAGLVGRRRRMD